jgi:DNA-binding CsgD family transcriptional regulator
VRREGYTPLTIPPEEIIRLFEAHYPQRLIAAQMGISRGQVSKLRSRLIEQGILRF